MFQGLRTIVYSVNDIEKAKTWYSRALGIEPYFDQPFYVGFNVGGFELGLQPQETEIVVDKNGPTTYWGVEDAEATAKHLLELGAREHSPVQDVGDNIFLGSMLDPFGNVFGFIKNPHFAIKTS